MLNVVVKEKCLKASFWQKNSKNGVKRQKKVFYLFNFSKLLICSLFLLL
jgi:hypothetical protein